MLYLCSSYQNSREVLSECTAITKDKCGNPKSSDVEVMVEECQWNILKADIWALWKQMCDVNVDLCFLCKLFQRLKPRPRCPVDFQRGFLHVRGEIWGWGSRLMGRKDYLWWIFTIWCWLSQTVLIVHTVLDVFFQRKQTRRNRTWVTLLSRQHGCYRTNCVLLQLTQKKEKITDDE